ncbi:hypothetical protein PSU4_28890 [Pseudonocardia sulfidoxydans NBRC 16205]|uniref:Thioredoxin-like fold domain-containing protein n=1 Tax=Pseudonocardia sulfidoxydans NBRC 16205 TaxID=1223511 RepID=A0A511DGK8_9PSEU|nr:hypothetical protein [Pseudonocardia sulfidoxydans]GEL23935.1 hypothetical protein PSU4_28890 [Pseudonocardia sulfidoxydans NBRC 16205]
MAARVRELVVVFDVDCPRCSRIARELPDCVTVKVRVRSCAEARLAEIYPNLPAPVAACGRPAIGVVRVDGSVRWWTGLTGAIGVLPVLRPGAGPRAVALLREAARGR